MMSRLLMKRSRNGSSPVSSKFPTRGEEQWEEIKCPICMEHPHNAVLLQCSSYNNGCRPFICNTSYRHSNCLDQYRSTSRPSSFPPSEDNNNNMISSSHHRGATSLGEGDDDKHELTCPLCRGSVSGWVVVEPVRRYLNTKSRECSSEDCGFVGNYFDLRKHARSDHPYVRPTQAQPERQQAWAQMEQEEEEEEELRLNFDDSSDVGDNLMVTLSVTMPDDEEIELRIEIPRVLLLHQSNEDQIDHVEDVNDNVTIDDSSDDVGNPDDSTITLQVTLPDMEDIELQIHIPRALLAPQSSNNHTGHTNNVSNDINIDGFGGRYGDNQAQPTIDQNDELQNQNIERTLDASQDLDFSWGRNRTNSALFQTRNRYGGMYGENQTWPTTVCPKVYRNGRQHCNQNFETNINWRREVDFPWGRNRPNNTLFQTRNNMYGDNQTWSSTFHSGVCWGHRRWNPNFERNLNVRRDANLSGTMNLSNGELFRTRNNYGGMYRENRTHPTATQSRVHWNGRRHRNQNFGRYLNVRRDVSFSGRKNHSNRALFRTRNTNINEIKMHEFGLATEDWWMS